MAKAAKKRGPKKRAEKHEEKAIFDGALADTIGLSANDAEKKKADKAAGDKDTKSLEDKIDAINIKKQQESASRKLDEKLRNL